MTGMRSTRYETTPGVTGTTGTTGTTAADRAGAAGAAQPTGSPVRAAATRTRMGHQVHSRSLARGCAAGAVMIATLVGAGAVPVQAAARTPADGVPAYKTEGKPVKGRASSADAPLLKPGTFTDTIKVGEKKYYAVDLDAVSPAHLSAFALPEPGVKVAYGDGLSLALQSTSGTDCRVGGDYTFGSDGATRPVGGSVSRVIDRDRECQEDGNYLFSVERKSDGTSDPEPWPVEIRYMSEPALAKGAKLNPVAPGSSATPAPPTGAPKSVKGGTGFNDAAAVDTGVFKSRIRAGQTLFYRVPVDWGQQLYATAEFANARKKPDGGYQSDGARLELFNTARGRVTGETKWYQGDQTASAVSTSPADYTNREDDSSDYAKHAMCFSGWYYLAVSLHPGADAFVEGSVGVTLRVNVRGKAINGPQYDGDPVKAGFGVSEDAYQPGAKSGGDGKSMLAFGAFGVGGALLLGLVVWMLLARRRPGDAVPVEPAGVGYHMPGPYSGPAGHPGYGNQPGAPGMPGGPAGPVGPMNPGGHNSGGQPPAGW